jgi:DNA-binding NarL/FixJ family response regulator
MIQPPSSVWVEVETTQEVVTVGLRTILETASGPLQITTTGPTGDEPDVVLYDVIHMRDGDDSGLVHWLTNTASTVIAIDTTLRPELGARAKEKRVEWAIDLSIRADELVAVIRDAIAGNLEDNPAAQGWEAGGYLGCDAGLTPRESDVLRLVTAGRSNHEIASTLLEHHLREVLHPQYLPQDRCRDPVPGRPVGHPQRVPDPPATDSGDGCRGSRPLAPARASPDNLPTPSSRHERTTGQRHVRTFGHDGHASGRNCMSQATTAGCPALAALAALGIKGCSSQMSGGPRVRVLEPRPVRRCDRRGRPPRILAR